MDDAWVRKNNESLAEVRRLQWSTSEVHPHDFRREVITDAIHHGIPPHIAQLVAGHREINTHHGLQGRLPRGVDQQAPGVHRTTPGTVRPAEQYRTPTDAE